MLKNIIKIRKFNLLSLILVMCIFSYPFINSFLGLDLGDTGYHYYAFERLYTQTEFLSFTSYLTNVIGWCWLKLFSDLGLWGLNFLEVIIEMLMAIFVYKTMAPYLGKNITLLGILIAVVASDTYLNIFNYHQFNVLLLIFILLMEFKANILNNYKYSFLAGIGMSIVFFARTGSITALVTLIIYIVWYLLKNKKINYLLKHYISFFLGFSFTSSMVIILLVLTGQLQFFINNVFRLSGLAASSDSGYNIKKLLDTFIFGNLDAMASGAIYLVSFIVLSIAFTLILKKDTLKKRLFNIFFSIILVIVGVYHLTYAYDVNPVNSWPQMTTAPSFIIGIFYVIAIICSIYHLYNKKGNLEITLLSLLSIILPLLTIAGSNTGTKHVILGLWMIAPICVYVVVSIIKTKDIDSVIHKNSKLTCIIKSYGVKVSLIVLIIAFLFKYIHMIYYTTNFDSVNRLNLTSYVNSDKVKWIRTTEREANAVNGVLDSLNSIKKERKLIVFGGSLMFYTLTERDSFVQPWFSNNVYDNEVLLNDLNNAVDREELPVIIYGRTNNYYGFYDYSYDVLRQSELTNMYNGKKDILIKFLQEHNYSVDYINEYYLVLLPSDLTNTNDKNYLHYMIE